MATVTECRSNPNYTCWNSNIMPKLDSKKWEITCPFRRKSKTQHPFFLPFLLFKNSACRSRITPRRVERDYLTICVTVISLKWIAWSSFPSAWYKNRFKRFLKYNKICCDDKDELQHQFFIGGYPYHFFSTSPATFAKAKIRSLNFTQGLEQRDQRMSSDELQVSVYIKRS